MTTVHFIYPHGQNISCPDAIGRKVGERLQSYYDVRYYDWDDFSVIKPEVGDVLIGHPHPVPYTLFRQSARQSGWKRVIALLPYSHIIGYLAFMESIIAHCDLYLAITGNYWYDSLKLSNFSHWQPKMIHVDLAIDREDFPAVKTRFNPPGQRRFLYVGHSGATKNPGYLADIAQRMPETRISWIGSGKKIRGLDPLGYQDFRTEESKKLISGYDFMITVSGADANPATILEAMAWGLIPVCTPQSGYVNYPGILNVPLNDPSGVVNVLRDLQSLPECKLQEMQERNWERLDSHFNWDRFAKQVISAIETTASPTCDATTTTRKLRIYWAQFMSLIGIYRSTMLKSMARNLLG